MPERKSAEAPLPEEVLPEDGKAQAPEDADNRQESPPEAGAPVGAVEAPPAPDYKDLYLRALAELDNFRKVAARDRRALIDSAAEGVLRKLLDPVDGFDRAVAELERVRDQAPPDLQPTLHRSVEGLRALQKQVGAVLASEGVERVDPRGELFDATRHEAVARVESADAGDGTIMDVVQVGYTLKGALLRPPRVVVATRPRPDDRTNGTKEDKTWRK